MMPEVISLVDLGCAAVSKLYRKRPLDMNLV